MVNWQWDRNVTSGQAELPLAWTPMAPRPGLIGPTRPSRARRRPVCPICPLTLPALVNFSTSFYYGCVSLQNKKIQKTETKHPISLHTHTPAPLCRTHVCFVDCFGFFIYLIKFRNTPANNLWLWNLHINPAKCCQIIELINIYLAHWPHAFPYPLLLPLWYKACTFIWQPETFNPCWQS